MACTSKGTDLSFLLSVCVRLSKGGNTQVTTGATWHHWNEEEAGSLELKSRHEDFAVRYNEDPAEAGNSPWQPGHSCQSFKEAQEGLGTAGDSHPGSTSQIYNRYNRKGMILRDGHGLSISAASPAGAASREKCTREFCYCFLKAPRGALSVKLSALQQKKPEKCCAHRMPAHPHHHQQHHLTPRNLIKGKGKHY